MHFQEILFVTTLCLTNILAQIPHLGRCPNYPVVQDFNVTQYMGTWYEIEKYFAIFELGGTCISAVYTDNGDGTVGVLNSQIQQGTGAARSISGSARLVSTDGSAKLGVTFPSVPFAGEAPYWVLGTDYGNYAIVWSCNNAWLVNFRKINTVLSETHAFPAIVLQIVWFLSRSRVPTDDVKLTVRHHLKYLGINTDHLQPTNQNNCFE